MSVEGEYFGANVSQKLATSLQRSDGTILLLDENREILSRTPMEEMTVEQALGTAPRRVTFPDGSLFVTNDHHGLELLGIGAPRGGLLHQLESFHPRLALFAVACVFTGWLFWRYGLDLLAGAAVALTPPVVVAQIDRSSMASLDRFLASPSELSEERQDHFRDMFEKLRGALPERHQDRAFNLQFRKVGLGPNAFALPGGTMVLTDALIKEFPDDDVVAAVLGHEMGHVIGDHGLRRLYRSLGIYVVVGIIAGDAGPFVEGAIEEGNLLLSLSYGRGQERSADDFGVRLASDAGYNPHALAIFFLKLSQKYGDGSGWMSSHPSNAERTKAIQNLASELGHPADSEVIVEDGAPDQ